MIDHLSSYTTRFDQARDFYDRAFEPLGYGRVHELVTTWDPEWTTRRCVAYGPPGKGCFWLIEARAAASPRHTAFTARDRLAVRRFHEAALAAGGIDDGPPGPRPQYHENYFGAFVIDPDGNFIEAVCHLPEPART